jgi:DNA cross-link repair 1A protein
LNFFKKADSQPQPTQPRITQFSIKVEQPGSFKNVPGCRENSDTKGNNTSESLFFRGGNASGYPTEGSTHFAGDDIWDDGNGAPEAEHVEAVRFNENVAAVKRQKVQSHPLLCGETVDLDRVTRTAGIEEPHKQSGPFLDISDSDSDVEVLRKFEVRSHEAVNEIKPSVFHRDTFADRQWAEEECETFSTAELQENNDEELVICPVCMTSLLGLSDVEVCAHVNGCLDRDSDLDFTESLPSRPESNEWSAIAKSAQRSPFTIEASGALSAFSKLMAGNAEDTAWAVAAANEVASRGKPSYTRTCPFYKIIPGFSICVDAFRYGAVEGCNAYFLSHFHSDHYVGLTSSWRHGPIYCSRVTGNLVRKQLKVDPCFIVDLEFEKRTEVERTNGVQVTMIPANHCPGSSLFLFEKKLGQGQSARVQRILHCGDFRASPTHVQHPLLRPETIDEMNGQKKEQKIDVCYLDTTYLNPKYAFPCQEDVVAVCADICLRLNESPWAETMVEYSKGGRDGGQITKFLSNSAEQSGPKMGKAASHGRLLVVVGTYSIGKERICMSIARALKCRIYAPPSKQRICACLEDPELLSLLTDDPLDAQVHMQILFEIRAETLGEYLNSLKPHFSRVVGFRPTGWTYRPPGGRLVDNPPVSSVLHSDSWKTSFTVQDLVPQRGSSQESSCFGVPYSEHSSFRELTMFCCALRIARVIPTVNVANRSSREKMKAWIGRWETEKRKSGLLKVEGHKW